MISNNIFLYHLDYELHKLFRIHTSYSQSAIYNSFKLITRLAYLLSTESVIIPASNYFESDVAFKIVNELSALNEFGVIKLTSSSLNLDELLAKKSIQHSPQNQNIQHHYSDFRSRDLDTPLYLPGLLVSRKRSASNDIQKAWLDSIGHSRIWEKLYKILDVYISVEKFEGIMHSIPDLLGDSAFISEYILPFLPLGASNIQMADTILNLFITQRYIESFLIEYDAMCFSNIPIIDSKLVLPDSQDSSKYIPFNKYAEKLFSISLNNTPAKDYINQCSAFELVSFKNSQLWRNTVQQVEEERSSRKRIDSKVAMLPGIAFKKGEHNMSKTLIITALSLELEQILESFIFPLHVDHDIKDNRHYYIISPNQQTTIVCTAILGMGQVNAALALKDALSYMTYDRVILAGICGGLSKKLDLGDIIVSEKIVDYELSKVLDDETIIRWNVYNSDYSIINSMKSFSSDRWKRQLCEEYPPKHSPTVFFGTVLSGNKVIASRKESRNLASVWDKALAIEMEASGIASALYQTPNSPPFIMVKSVCDFADKEKNDDWQIIAAKTAAVYVIDFIFSLKGCSSASNVDRGFSQETDRGFSQENNIFFVLSSNYNLSELNVLCFNLGLDIEELGGQGKSEIIVELIKCCQRRMKMLDLIAQINQDRNNILGQSDIAK